jgi:hypothetical protein
MRFLRQTLSVVGLTVVAGGLSAIATIGDRHVSASPPTPKPTHLAQFGLPDVTPDLPDSLPLPELSDLLEEDPPLTTSLEDVRRETPLLDGENFGEPQSLASLERGARGGYIAPPGLYEAILQSYCLRAGTHAPGGGDGYAYAPLEGPRAGIITKILRESANYPEIPQRQIQVLLWGIIAQTRVSDMDEEIQSVARQLLSDEEIAEINGGALGLIPDEVRRELFANLPSQVRQILDAKAEIRERLSEANATYEELENIAVLTGAVSRGEGSREIPEGRWSLHPDGYFVRYFPSGYRRTRMEALVPRPATVVRDDRDRIAAIDYGDGYRLETDYDDEIGAIPVAGEPEMNIYYFSAVRLVSPEGTIEVRDRGWTFVGTPTTGEARFSQGFDGTIAATKNVAQVAQRRRIDTQEAIERYQDAKAKADKAQTTLERLDEPTRDEAEEILDRDHYKDGVEAVAENDPEAKGEWLGEHFQRAQQAWAYAICKVSNLGTSATCGEPDPDPDPDPEPDPNPDPDPDPDPPGTPVDPGGDGAIPGNTNRQRLGISGRLS